MKNTEIGWIFHEMADLMEIKGTNDFEIMAYRNGAKIISHIEEPVENLVNKDELIKTKGIGKGLLSKVKEILKTGTCTAYQDLLNEVPREILSIRSLPGIGPQKARLLYESLHISNLEELEKAIKKRKVRELPGMSAKTELKLLRNIKILKNGGGQVLLGLALDLADELVGFLKEIPGVQEVKIGGGTRRWKEMVSDLDLVVAAEEPNIVFENVATHPRVTKILERKERRLAAFTWWGVEVDISVVSPENFVVTWHRNTGSNQHYNHLMLIAQEKRMNLSHKGLWDADGKKIEVKTESEIYQQLGLNYIPPELREDKGEIELAAIGKLPSLLEVEAIKGDLHCHTNWSDAANTVEEMMQAAQKMGYRYLAITDHSQSLKIANGLNKERLHQQGELIARLNAQEKDFRLLSGVECDILENGKMDYDDEMLSQLDVVVASVHQGFNMDEETMTERIIAAIKNEHVDIVGHLTGRLLGRRNPYPVDVEKVLEAAAQNKTVLEINSSPDRLDLCDKHVTMAKKMGVKIAINTDSHDVNGLQEIKYGIAVAKRAWLSDEDVVNTLEVEDLLKILK